MVLGLDVAQDRVVVGLLVVHGLEDDVLVQVLHMHLVKCVRVGGGRGRGRLHIATFGLRSFGHIADFEKALIIVATLFVCLNFIDQCVHIVLRDLDDPWLFQWHLDASKASCARACKA